MLDRIEINYDIGAKMFNIDGGDSVTNTWEHRFRTADINIAENLAHKLVAQMIHEVREEQS